MTGRLRRVAVPATAAYITTIEMRSKGRAGKPRPYTNMDAIVGSRFPQSMKADQSRSLQFRKQPHHIALQNLKIRFTIVDQSLDCSTQEIDIPPLP